MNTNPHSNEIPFNIGDITSDGEKLSSLVKPIFQNHHKKEEENDDQQQSYMSRKRNDTY